MTEDWTTQRLAKKTLEKLNKIGIRSETFDSLINRLIDYYNSKQKR